MRRILVSSNCQTAGIAAALRGLTSGYEIHAVPLTGESPEALRLRLRGHLHDTDLWFLSPENNVARELAASEGGQGLRTLLVPTLHFAAFHPDLCYAWHRDTKRLTDPHYNSAIVVWAYSQGLDVERTARLFNRHTFRALGYFNSWNASTEGLRKAFAASDLRDRFADFFLRVKRSGCFMHSLNHPKVDAIVHLSRLAAEVAGMPIVREVISGELHDGLNAIVWPVYPDLAHELGLEGHYRWKQAGKTPFIDGLEAYIAHTFAGYAAQELRPQDITIAFQDMRPYDRVLRELACD